MIEKYNWFSNKNTYLFDLYFNPKTNEELYEYQFILEMEKNNIENPFIKNLVDFSDINYQELEELIIENKEY